MTLTTDHARLLAYRRAVRSLAEGMIAPALTRHPDIRVRAIGSLLSRLHETEVRWSLGLADGPDKPDEHDVEAFTNMVRVVQHLFDPSYPAEDSLEAIHRFCLDYDSRSRVAGSRGTGEFREHLRQGV